MKNLILFVVIVSAIMFAGCIEEPQDEAGGLPSNLSWDINKHYNKFTAAIRIDDLDNLFYASNNVLFVDTDFALHDENERVQFYNMDLDENEKGDFILSADYEGDLSLKTEKINLATGEVLSATPFQDWNGSRTFSSQEIALSPGEALVVVLTWKI